MNFLVKKIKNYLIQKKKKIKFKVQSFGIDNYARLKNLNPNLSINATYLLE